MAFEYYYGKQADQYSFIKVPKLLVHDKAFIGLSVDAKMLYGLLFRQNEFIYEKRMAG